MAERLFKRGKVWYGWYFETNGRRVQRSTKCRDKRAAEAVVREWERRAADPAHAAAHEATLAEALRRLLIDRRLKQRAEGTIQSYRTKGGHLLRILGPNLRLAEVDARAVDTFIERRLDEGAARNTIHKELTVLRSALKVAKRRGEYARDIAEVMPDGFSPEYKPRTRFLTPDEAEKLLAELTPDRAARVAFILGTGARWRESERARLADVDLARGLVHLRGTKTTGARRTVPLVGVGPELVEHALRYAEGTGGPLFRHWGSARRDIADACERAGIERVSPNDLRRTCATWLRQSGVEPHLIGAVLGHTDSRMVERVYGRLPIESLLAALRARVPIHESAPDDCSAFVAATCVDEGSQQPQTHPSPPTSAGFLVPRDRIELPTRGFSIPVSRRQRKTARQRTDVAPDTHAA